MASADDYANWIVANESKKGTDEFNTVAQAYQEAKTEEQSKPQKIDFSIPTPEALHTSSVNEKPTYTPLSQKALGIGEAALSAASTTPAIAGGYYGMAKNVLQGKPAEQGLMEGMGNLTYQPRTQAGQQYTENLGNAINASGIAGLGPMVLPTKGMPMMATKAPEELGQSTGMLRRGAESLMQSALKPTIAQLRSGQAKTAIDTLLKYGINPTAKGVEELKNRVGNINEDIANTLEQSHGTVSKQNVLARIGDVYDKFKQQVAPTADVNAIQGVTQDFLGSNVGVGPRDTIPVQLAQKLKQGTYKVLAGKYGEAGSAATEAQKALARGLKEEIAVEVPEVAQLNKEESKLIDTLNVTERRALMDLNKNPAGLSLLTTNPTKFAAFMADKSALFKSLLARTLNRVGTLAPIQSTQNKLIGGMNLMSNVNPQIAGSLAQPVSKAQQLGSILQNKEQQ